MEARSPSPSEIAFALSSKDGAKAKAFGRGSVLRALPVGSRGAAQVRRRHIDEMLSGYENLARTTFMGAPTPVTTPHSWSVALLTVGLHTGV